MHESPEDIPLQPWRPKHEHSVTPREERDIGDEDEGLGFDTAMNRYHRIEPFPYRLDIDTILLRELREGLLVPDVFFPKNQLSAFRSSFPLKLSSAMHASVSLDTPSLSVLLHLNKTASQALFLYIITNVLLITASVCHGMEFLSSRFYH